MSPKAFLLCPRFLKRFLLKFLLSISCFYFSFLSVSFSRAFFNLHLSLILLDTPFLVYPVEDCIDLDLHLSKKMHSQSIALTVIVFTSCLQENEEAVNTNHGDSGHPFNGSPDFTVCLESERENPCFLYLLLIICSYPS